MATDIYGPLKKVKKSESYMMHGQGNLIGIRDKQEFARKKRILGQRFSDTAVREQDQKMTEQIDLFCENVSDAAGVDGWSAIKNVTFWCLWFSQTCLQSD